MRLDLDLLRYKDQLQIRRDDGKSFIFDPVRKKWLVLQPEEMVRQLVRCYLTEERGYRKTRLSMERGIQVNSLQRRFDLLAYDAAVEPFLLIECKAPKVKIGPAVFEQAAWYNTQLRVPYLMVTNGMDTYCCAMDYDQRNFTFLDTVPEGR